MQGTPSWSGGWIGWGGHQGFDYVGELAGAGRDRPESLHEVIDTTSTSGKLTFHIFAALAEFERQLIQERTQAGLKRRASPRPRGRTPQGLSAGKQQRAVQLYQAKAADREGNLRDDGDLQADPLCLCPPGASLLIARLRPSPTRKASRMPKQSRGQKRQAKTQKAPTTSRETLVTTVQAVAGWDAMARRA